MHTKVDIWLTPSLPLLVNVVFEWSPSKKQQPTGQKVNQASFNQDQRFLLILLVVDWICTAVRILNHKFDFRTISDAFLKDEVV